MGLSTAVRSFYVISYKVGRLSAHVCKCTDSVAGAYLSLETVLHYLAIQMHEVTTKFPSLTSAHAGP